ncbi:hypothetical protein NB636_02065 [Oxalobacter aliiformigenes]|uniref:hypothetical protein n=1 Tax=Oxalobacter aliiformigenes TaxID=2946593 RepID=UPI0022B025E7|nr:hypothetical protein [Oxalobacter aliiformigenes]MCZ4065452.1 hypothetical protein [Oxalobacter aliiformigenes]WAV99673.1 hypothetical protein NB636_02065 [Oxalobacter aliiformigenes]
MAQPPAYNREKDFVQNFGNETDHAALNAEFDRASNSINDIRTNLALIQADDGKIRASSITTDSLSQEVLDYVQEKALAGANAVADAATAIAEEAKTMAGKAAETAVGATEIAGLSEEKAQQAIEASNSAVEKADQALLEANQIDSKVGSAVTEALAGVDITGLNAVTIHNALGYVPYDAETNSQDFATSAEVAEAISEIPNADWNATEGAAEIKNKPGDFGGATAETAGKQGFVPAPEAGDQNKVLKGDGTWGAIASRNIGETVFSLLPLTDAGLHLLDGSLLSVGGIYDDFITHVASLRTDYPGLFVTEDDWQTSVTSYGVCGKFVYTEGVSLRIPKITGFVEGTLDGTALGDLVEAGLPNIAGISAVEGAINNNSTETGPFTSWRDIAHVFNTTASGTHHLGGINFDASRANPIYGNSVTVQPQSIKGYLYMVVATSSKTDIEVDIDRIATDLAAKVDIDLGNLNTTGKAKVANLAMPSASYVNLTLGASGAYYTAPADGYISLIKRATQSGEYVAIYGTAGIQDVMWSIGATQIFAIAPVRKGTAVKINYSASGILDSFVFVYAEGSKP